MLAVECSSRAEAETSCLRPKSCTRSLGEGQAADPKMLSAMCFFSTWHDEQRDGLDSFGCLEHVKMLHGSMRLGARNVPKPAVRGI